MTEHIVSAHSIERNKKHQMDMARNIGKLTTKAAQKRQAQLLCRSLKRSILGGAE